MPENTWLQLFPTLAAGDPATRVLLEGAHGLELPPDQPVFFAGSPCPNYVLMLEGSIRVQVIGEGGREALLYRLLPGQACVLTTCCILSGNDYPAEAFTESPVKILVIAKPAFDRALAEAPSFRRFVFDNLGGRIAQLITRMEELAFRPIDRRLVDFLLLRSAQAPSKPIAATHQDIATELGTAREVVTRHLKRMEAAGLLRRGRSTIQILDRQGLERIVVMTV
jgi:CRP/FNR family transcriptional regulator